MRTYREIQRDRISMVAGSIAYSSVLALFPALIALVSVFGLFADPALISQQLRKLSEVMPLDVRELVMAEVISIVERSSSALTWGVVLSIVGSLWATSGGVAALIHAVNLAYGEDEKRNFFELRLVALGLTLFSVFGAMIVILLVAVLPTLFELFGLGATLLVLLDGARWITLALLIMMGLAVLYRYAPCRPRSPNWQLVTWGSLVATLLWLLSSVGFSIYVANFGSYNKTYGAIGGVIVLLLWLFITAFAVLLGAEVDAEVEREIARRIARHYESTMQHDSSAPRESIPAGPDTTQRDYPLPLEERVIPERIEPPPRDFTDRQTR